MSARANTLIFAPPEHINLVRDVATNEERWLQRWEPASAVVAALYSDLDIAIEDLETAPRAAIAIEAGEGLRGFYDEAAAQGIGFIAHRGVGRGPLFTARLSNRSLYPREQLVEGELNHRPHSFEKGLGYLMRMVDTHIKYGRPNARPRD